MLDFLLRSKLVQICFSRNGYYGRINTAINPLCDFGGKKLGSMVEVLGRHILVNIRNHLNIEQSV